MPIEALLLWIARYDAFSAEQPHCSHLTHLYVIVELVSNPHSRTPIVNITRFVLILLIVVVVMLIVVYIVVVVTLQIMWRDGHTHTPLTHRPHHRLIDEVNIRWHCRRKLIRSTMDRFVGRLLLIAITF